jgi:hypothetical protein
MILVKDGKREPGHMDMQKLDEFCNIIGCDMGSIRKQNNPGKLVSIYFSC